MDKKKALEALAQEIADQRLPLDREANLVFGEGDIHAEVMFIGEAPGRDEDIQKRPFVGRGGQLLNKMLEEIGWRREDVYITNIVKRRPPDNRDPLPEEIKAYEPYLTRQIGLIDPAIIIPLGRFAMHYFLPNAKITKDQGKIFRTAGRCVVPMLHPAAALRSPEAMQAFQETFRKLPKIVAKCKSLPPSAAKRTLQSPKKKQLF